MRAVSRVAGVVALALTHFHISVWLPFSICQGPLSVGSADSRDRPLPLSCSAAPAAAHRMTTLSLDLPVDLRSIYPVNLPVDLPVVLPVILPVDATGWYQKTSRNFTLHLR